MLILLWTHSENHVPASHILPFYLLKQFFCIERNFIVVSGWATKLIERLNVLKFFWLCEGGPS